MLSLAVCGSFWEKREVFCKFLQKCFNTPEKLHKDVCGSFRAERDVFSQFPRKCFKRPETLSLNVAHFEQKEKFSVNFRKYASIQLKSSVKLYVAHLELKEMLGLGLGLGIWLDKAWVTLSASEIPLLRYSCSKKLWPPSALEPASGGFVVLVDGKEVVMVLG